MLLESIAQKVVRLDLLSGSSPEDRSRIQHYVFFILIGLPVLIGFGSYNLLIKNMMLGGLVLGTAGMLTIGLILLRISRRTYLIVRSCGLCYLFLLAYLALHGGESGSKLLWVYTWPTVICFITGYKEGTAWSLALLLTLIVSFYTPLGNYFSYERYPLEFEIRFISTYALLTAMSAWLEYSRSFYRNESATKNKALIEEHERLNNEIEKRIRLEKALTKAAQTDFLTGILNRGAFWTYAEKELLQHLREEKSLSFAVIDIDHFKAVNDNYGHPAGDQVIKDIAHISLDTIREVDILGRIGGEEFAIIMLGANKEQADMIVERIRLRVEKTVFLPDSVQLPCTISIGIYTSDKETSSIEDAYRRADQALYKAKESGRNKISHWKKDLYTSEIRHY